MSFFTLISLCAVFYVFLGSVTSPYFYKNTLLSLINDFYNLFFPETCACCNVVLSTQENVVCLACRYKLPLTKAYLYNENTVKKLFYGRLPLINAVSLLYFYKKGITQQLIHQLKYKKDRQISKFLGEWIAEELAKTDWITQIEAIVPVPLHKKRLQERGYNQVEGFGKAISKIFGIEYIDDVLIKKAPTRTQVFKERIARATLKDEFFMLKNKEKLYGKHVLLVDDIVTTGATIETCANVLLKIPQVKLSIATMAITA